MIEPEVKPHHYCIIRKAKELFAAIRPDRVEGISKNANSELP